MSAGTGPAWPSESRAATTRPTVMGESTAFIAEGSDQGAGSPGRQLGGRGITWGGTGRDTPATL